MKKLIKILLIISFVFVNANMVFSQLKVESDGSLYVHSYKGNYGRANWTKVHYQYSCAYHLWNTYYNGDVFYVRGDGYVWTRNGFLIASDSMFKANVVTISSPLEIIKSLRGVTYNRWYQISSILNDPTNPSSTSNFVTKYEIKLEPKEYGLIAQEVESIIPEAVHTMDDSTKAISYQSLIPVLIEAIKEQQLQIEALQNIVVVHEEEIIMLKRNSGDLFSQKSTSNSTVITEVIENLGNAVLYQNTPNPFTDDTEIKYNIPKEVKSANIYVHDLQGKQMKSYDIQSNNTGSLLIKGSELNAGMYIYTLIVDNQIIDTKRMILTEK